MLNCEGLHKSIKQFYLTSNSSTGRTAVITGLPTVNGYKNGQIIGHNFLSIEQEAMPHCDLVFFFPPHRTWHLSSPTRD